MCPIPLSEECHSFLDEGLDAIEGSFHRRSEPASLSAAAPPLLQSPVRGKHRFSRIQVRAWIIPTGRDVESQRPGRYHEWWSNLTQVLNTYLFTHECLSPLLWVGGSTLICKPEWKLARNPSSPNQLRMPSYATVGETMFPQRKKEKKKRDKR